MGCGDDGPATGEVGFSGDESSCSEELIKYLCQQVFGLEV